MWWREEKPGSLPGPQLKVTVGTGVETHYASVFQQPTPTWNCYSQAPVTKYSACISDCQRAPAVYTGSWIFTSHTPNMVSPAAYQPVSTGERPAVCATKALRLTLSWEAEWKLVWLLVAADSLVINNHNWSQRDLEARVQSPFQIAVFVWTISLRSRKQEKTNYLNPMGPWNEIGKRNLKKEKTFSGSGKGSKNRTGEGPTSVCHLLPTGSVCALSELLLLKRRGKQVSTLVFCNRPKQWAGTAENGSQGHSIFFLACVPSSQRLGHLVFQSVYLAPKDYGPCRNNKEEPARG